MKRWQIIGFIATLGIVLSIPLYIFRVSIDAKPELSNGQIKKAVFVGVEKCASCHEQEVKKWQGSDHDKAMAPANEKTVLGNFDDTIFEHQGIVSRFFRRGDEFYVNTQGPDGKPGDFRITYTFGYTPLQQYLIPFKDGRLQCLPIAWDVNKKRWYHLNPDEKITPADWMHWTGQSHNWNGMCAECHSTQLKKQYNANSDTYQTTWSEIDVSCEACHGPGSLHVKWADQPELARPDSQDFGLVLKTVGLDSKQQIAVCARCHSRRIQLGPFDHSEKEMMDSIIPELLTESLYHPDGQILDEVYVYGSFVQSKMYHNDVKCSDCHDVHSGKRVQEGNSLCLQCHRADEYDSETHHFHQKAGESGSPVKDLSGKVIAAVGEGAECVKCHMPGQYYMGVDYRPDHSLRIPRPDLSTKLGTPNACNQCHVEETKQWAVDHYTQWYGISRKPHYGSIIAAGRLRTPEAKKDLIRLTNDPLFPSIVRATTLQLLSSYLDEESYKVFDRSLGDEEALIRYTAVRHYNRANPEQRIEQLVPLLYDPIKSIRMEAAMSLAAFSLEHLKADDKKAFNKALSEYENAMEYSADFTFAGLNLGNLYYYLGQPEKAEGRYRKAIRIAHEFNPARINLAVLLSGQGKKKEAEKLLREVIEIEPEAYEAYYKLGLLLVEEKKHTEAVEFLTKAANGFGSRARIYYNLGLLLQSMNRNAEAEKALLKAVELNPTDSNFVYALSLFYFKSKRFIRAQKFSEELVKKHPKNAAGKKLLNLVNRKLQLP